jgi:DNA-binding GntR family transcriptional regulator
MENKDIKKETKQLPLYKQISELLQREITAGHWLPGERLPIESELAGQLKVAVGTLRKALAKLEGDGLLERRQGSGTYVKRAPSGSAIYQFFHLELVEGGGVPSADTLSVDCLQSSEIATKLALEYSKAQLWSIKRLRYLNKVAVAVEEIWIDRRHTAELRAVDLHESLYMYYRENFDFWITRVEDRVGCAEAPDWACETLGLNIGTVLGRVERKGWSNRGQLEEFSRTWFLPDRSCYIARWS